MKDFKQKGRHFLLFLDDIRNPEDYSSYMPDTLSLTQYYKKKELELVKSDWVIVRNYEEFREALVQNAKLPHIVSLDHDLCDEHYKEGFKHNFDYFNEDAMKTPTGYHCTKFLIDFASSIRQRILNVLFHTMNSCGKIYMQELIDDYNNNIDSKPAEMSTNQSVYDTTRLIK